MPNEGSKCSCIADTAALHEIANMSANMQSLFLEALKDGVIGVPACVWDEFTEAYDDEAAALKQYISHKPRLLPKHHANAGKLADKLNSSLSFSVYDRHSDLYVASMCDVEGYTLLTTEYQLPVFKKMDCCKAVELTAWASEQG